MTCGFYCMQSSSLASVLTVVDFQLLDGLEAIYYACYVQVNSHREEMARRNSNVSNNLRLCALWHDCYNYCSMCLYFISCIKEIEVILHLKAIRRVFEY